jgi:pyruvate/2-oxoglutarate dehydrogenase complex dihydrolipoamide acyltransferase (E2) component
MTDIKLPKSFSSFVNLRINHWFYEEGDEVHAGSDLLEVLTDHGPVTIQCSKSGVLDEVYYITGDEIASEDVLGVIS